MKQIITNTLVIVLISLLCSCGADDQEEIEEIIAEPCDFDISNIIENSTTVLDCTIDLNGDSVTLPTSVTLEYDGGSIINGTLVFSGGSIDGRLLNSQLELSGAVTLIDPLFNFDKENWDIVEGEVGDEIAKSNKDIIQSLINQIKEMGGSTFMIDDLDAYFKVDVPLSEDTPERAAITLPSDFTLKMTDNTHLRMQANANIRPTLLSVTGGNSNVTIEGGNLYGDRDTHDYSDGQIHAWGHILRIKAADGVTVKGVTFTGAMGDGINVSGLYHYFQPEHITSQNVMIVENTFIDCRRISLGITSGHYITIDGNTFIDGGRDTEFSDGVAPSCNINIEPVRNWEDGIVGTTLIEYEKVTNLTIINNTQRGEGSFLVSHCDGPVIVDNNDMESVISYTIANGVRVTNNTFNYNPVLPLGTAISVTGTFEIGTHPLVFDNEISGNEIYGYSTGINLAGQNVKVFDNHIETNSGIVFNAGDTDGIVNAEVYDNTIKAGQYGITAKKLLKDVVIENNVIEAATFPIFFSGVNNDEDEIVKLFVNNNTFRGNHIEGTTYASKLSNITSTRGLELTENTVTGGFEIVDCNEILINTNTITSTSTDGVIFFKTPSTNVEVNDNIIDVADEGNYSCINETVDLDNTVVFDNNSCQ